ncbi:MAG: 3-isopropylmalate dehydratase small subunit [Candidatus Parcubacteria bacterium]|nr:3-isopropylmalate dehydratase small subunit [Candidatus Parcubacteria bacterium]
MDKIIIKEKIIRNITGTAIPKPADDQNTDDIVPARYLKEITFKNMGNYAYYDERFKDGKTVEHHPFNDEKYKGASILIVGANYGCGSSREHAPQALYKYGIKAIIAGSFAEIFASNCANLGIAGMTIPAGNIKELANHIQKNPQTELDINLEEKIISYDKKVLKLNIPEGRRQSFLGGSWDALAILQKNEEAIKSVEIELDYLNFK